MKSRSLPKGGTGRTSAAYIARLGLLFALAICLSFLESLIPPIAPIPGIKIGLSNIVTMYCAYTLGARQACTLAVLKGLFAVLTRGAVAALLSLSGGLCSVLIMLLLIRLLGDRARVAVVSVAGAVAHNMAQLLIATGLLRLVAVFWYYLSLLVAAGVGVGLLTAVLLGALMPHLAAVEHTAQSTANRCAVNRKNA